jgi:hypothetical protein
MKHAGGRTILLFSLIVITSLVAGCLMPPPFFPGPGRVMVPGPVVAPRGVPVPVPPGPGLRPGPGVIVEPPRVIVVP